MSIPKYHELMLPMLNELASGAEFPIWVPGDFLKGDRPELLLAS